MHTQTDHPPLRSGSHKCNSIFDQIRKEEIMPERYRGVAKSRYIINEGIFQLFGGANHRTFHATAAGQRRRDSSI